MGLIKTDGIVPNGATGLLLFTDIYATVVGLKLESGGGVGFGNDAVPSGLKVDVLGNIATATLSIPTSSTIAGINAISTMRIGQTNSSIKLNIGCNGSSSWIQSYNISNNAGAPLLLQSGEGNVGIGTASPASPLHIKGTPDQLLLLEGIGTASYMRFTTGGINRGYFGHFSIQKGMYLINQRAASDLDSSLYLGTADSVRLTITGNGNVGIGTTAPLVALDVVGEARSSTSTIHTSNAKTLVTKDYTDATRCILVHAMAIQAATVPINTTADKTVYLNAGVWAVMFTTNVQWGDSISYNTCDMSAYVYTSDFISIVNSDTHTHEKNKSGGAGYGRIIMTARSSVMYVTIALSGNYQLRMTTPSNIASNPIVKGANMLLIYQS